MALCVWWETAVTFHGESDPSNTATVYGCSLGSCNETLVAHDTAVANHYIPPSKQQARPSFLPSYSPVNPGAIVRVTYSVAGQAIAVRVSGDPVAGNNGLFYIYSDHLGSTNVLSDLNGAEVGNSHTRYLPFRESNIGETPPRKR